MPLNPPPSGPQTSGSSPSQPPDAASIWLRLAFDPRTHPEIYLRGLEQWLELGLICDAEVRLQCSQLLACQLPRKPQTCREQSQVSAIPTSRPIRLSAAAAPPKMSEPASRRRSPLEALGTSLAEEFSLNWLLALGVFVVVVSSGALAASQWQQVSNLGQYAILWGYTLAFFGTGLWLGRSEKLRLTGQTIRAMALFLVPMNGWAMDGLKLWSSAAGWGLAAIASFSLVALGWKTLRIRAGSPQVLQSAIPLAVQGCALALSGLQWGWGIGGWPLVATYAGAILASIGFWYGEGFWQQEGSQSQERTDERGSSASDAVEPSDIQQSNRFSQANTSDRPAESVRTSPSSTEPSILGRSLLAVGIALLLVRAGLDPGIEIAQLGLAIGIFGWQLGWIARSRVQPQPWLLASAILFVQGWRLTIGEVPLQALCISVLAAWIVGDRLRRLWKLPDVLLLFGLTTQGLVLVWLSVPDSVRMGVLAVATQVFGSAYMPDALSGLGLFPAVSLAAWGADWLRGRDKLRLAIGLERAALGLGAILALFAVWNLGVRALYFAASAGVLAAMVRRRSPTPRVLIYLTHSMGVLAAVFAIDALFPAIGVNGWGAISTGFALLEWGFLAYSSHFTLWRRSSWYIGLGLGVAGYGAFLGHLVYRLATDSTGNGLWGVLWFAIPIASTLASQRISIPLRLPPVPVTIAGLIAGQLLTVETLETQLAGWAIAAAAMAGLTYCQPTTLRASLSLGFALFGVAIGIAEFSPNPPDITAWMFAIATAVLVLWLGHWQVKARGQLGVVAGKALYGWGIGLAALNLLCLLTYTVGLYLDGFPSSGLQIVAAWLMVAAIAVCASQQLGLLETIGLAVAVELATAGTIAALTVDAIPLATVNLALALAIQMGADLWVQRTERDYPKGSLGIPAVYAGGGFLLSLSELNSYSGLYALALALVLVGLGRRRPNLEPWTIAGLVALSVALYQTAIYQLLQAGGGDAGDGIAILGGLAIAIAAAYQALPAGVSRYWRISSTTVTGMGTLHWCGGSLLLILAWLLPNSTTGQWIWVGAAIGAATYAMIRGRTESGSTYNEPPSTIRVADEFLVDKWMYAGIAWGAIAIAYSLLWVTPEPLPVLYWSGAIAAAVCSLVLLCPWQAWGWSTRPWHRAAMILPGLVVGATLDEVGWQSLLLVAAYYAWLTLRLRRVRLSYMALLLTDVGLIKLLGAVAWLDSFWLVLILGGSGLYAAHVDPALSSPAQRDTRHWIRCLLIAVVCLTISVQLESTTGLTMGGIMVGLAVTVAGLLLKVRAYLYVGTASFAIVMLRQTWLAIVTSSVALWSIGILLGLGLIWVAATFEARRDSTIRQLQAWSSALSQWE